LEAIGRLATLHPNEELRCSGELVSVGPGEQVGSNWVAGVVADTPRLRTRVWSSLRNEFAFAEWDPDKAELLLVRDATGGRALFFSQWRNGVVFANRPFIVARVVGATPDPQSAAAYIVGLPFEALASLWKDVQPVPAGHEVRFGRSDNWCAHVRRWHRWKAPKSVAAAVAASVEFASEPGPVAVSMSAGVDSVAIAGLADQPLLITQSYPNTSADETASARAIGRILGARHEFVEPLATNFLNPTTRLELLENQLFRPTLWAAACDMDLAKAGGCRLLLSGVGGDQFFGPGFSSRWAIARHWSRAVVNAPLHGVTKARLLRWIFNQFRGMRFDSQGDCRVDCGIRYMAQQIAPADALFGPGNCQRPLATCAVAEAARAFRASRAKWQLRDLIAPKILPHLKSATRLDVVAAITFRRYSDIFPSLSSSALLREILPLWTLVKLDREFRRLDCTRPAGYVEALAKRAAQLALWARFNGV